VLKWRVEAEEKMKASGKAGLSQKEIKTFNNGVQEMVYPYQKEIDYQSFHSKETLLHFVQHLWEQFLRSSGSTFLPPDSG
jgi:pantothenate kinase-related protein Tda10